MLWTTRFSRESAGSIKPGQENAKYVSKRAAEQSGSFISYNESMMIRRRADMQEPKDMIFEQDETDGFRVSLCPTESSKNGNGAVHGGVIFLLCEETMARYMRHAGKRGAAAEANIHYYRPAWIGEKMTASVSERKIGKRLGTYLIEVKNEKGDLLAETMITISYFQQPI